MLQRWKQTDLLSYNNIKIIGVLLIGAFILIFLSKKIKLLTNLKNEINIIVSFLRLVEDKRYEGYD